MQERTPTSQATVTPPPSAQLQGRSAGWPPAAVVPGTWAGHKQGEGPEVALCIPVAKRQGFHKLDGGSPAAFLPFLCLSVSPNLVIMSEIEDPETNGLRSTFSSYMAEGERLYLCGEFSKAARSFSNVSQALNLSIIHHHFGCLITAVLMMHG